MEGSDVLFRVGFDSRMVWEGDDNFGTMAFAPYVVAMTTEAEAGVTGHAH